MDKIKNVEFLGGNTNTGEALNYIREKAFPNNKAPYDSTKPRIAIILTDGQSNDVHRTMAEASKAKSEGIALFVIGIGKQVILLFQQCRYLIWCIRCVSGIINLHRERSSAKSLKQNDLYMSLLTTHFKGHKQESGKMISLPLNMQE